MIFGPFFIMPFTIFSGFFLRYYDAPSFVRWLFQASFLKHGLVGVVLSIYGMDRPNIECSDVYCHYKYPSLFLMDNDVVGERFSMLFVALFGIGLIVSVLAFLILKIRLKSKWWWADIKFIELIIIARWDVKISSSYWIWQYS